MTIEPLNIIGRRQLMIDPRIVAEQNNILACMSWARKLPRVMVLDEKLKTKPIRLKFHLRGDRLDAFEVK